MEWISASSTRNYLLANPLIDWLQLHGVAKGYVQDSHTEGYDPRLEFSRFIMAKGLAFEQAIVRHIETLGDMLTISRSPRQIRDPAMAEKTIAAMADGQPIIYQGVLHHAESETFGAPDFLFRSDILASLFPGSLAPAGAATRAPTLGAGPWHYVVVDAKYTTVHLNAAGTLGNDGSARAYKGQLYIYNRALAAAQGFSPEQAFLLGRGWQQDSKGGGRGANAMERLGPVAMDDAARVQVDAAVDWARRVRAEGVDWTALPVPSVNELWPNMSETGDFPWHTAKATIARELGEITQLWQVGLAGRTHAHRQGITDWRTPGVSAAATFDVKGPATEPLLDALVAVNHDPNGPPVRPDHVAAAEGEWRPVPPIEFYVDFETVSSLNDDFSKIPEQNGRPLIFMIGCGHVDDERWVFRSFVAEALTEDAEARVIDDWLAHMAALERSTGSGEPAHVIHWSPAETAHFETAYNSAQERHADKEWPALAWFDFLKRVIRAEPVVVRGSLSFGLKPFAKALLAHGLIETSWGDSQLDGLGAMTGAWAAADEARGQGVRLIDIALMQEIARYNEVDCKTMMEIMRYLRANH